MYSNSDFIDLFNIANRHNAENVTSEQKTKQHILDIYAKLEAALKETLIRKPIMN